MQLLNLFSTQRPKDRPEGVTPPAKSLLVNILRTHRTQFNQGLSDWKAARLAATDPQRPNRYLLQSLYEQMAADAYVHSLMRNRTIGLTSRHFSFVDEQGRPLPRLTALIGKEWFEQYARLWVSARFFGTTVIEAAGFREGELVGFKLLDRTHVRPEAGVVVRNPYDEEGVSYVNHPFCLEIENADSLGLLDAAAVPYVLTKNSWSSWSEFEEMFGIPLRLLKHNVDDRRTQVEMENWLRDMGKSGYGMFPDGVEVEIRESRRSDAFEVFLRKIERARRDLRILFLGQTLTIEDGTNRAQAEVHERLQNDLFDDDARGFLRHANGQLLPFLRLHGYDIPEGVRIVEDGIVNLHPKERIDLLKVLIQSGERIDKGYLEYAYDIRFEGEAAS